MHRQLISVLLLLGSACGDGADGEPLAHQIDDAREHVDAVRAEVEAHAATAAQATDLSALQALEPTHTTTAGEHMEMLGHAMGDMGMCDDALEGEVDAMMDMRGQCMDELDRHAQAIATASDLAAARTEEDRHRTTMMDRLDDLDDMGDAMMDGHGTMMCGGHHGLDDHEHH